MSTSTSSSSRSHFSASASASASAPTAASFAPPPPRDAVITGHPSNNVPESVYEKMGSNLHRRPDHPICIIKEAIYEYFDALEAAGKSFKKFDDLPCVVPATSNFDAVLVPKDHVSRSPNDTYYVDDATVLRCHTSAHQLDSLRGGERAFLVTGDVYRRDSIDASHYPVFHQMEGVRVFEPSEFRSSEGASSSSSADDDVAVGTAYAEKELKRVLEGLAKHLFGSETETRWVDAYFPFTEPSFELEVLFQGEWLEVLGCGVMQREILRNAGMDRSEGDQGGERVAWAFGLGLERLAMVLFGIPDIRLFWSGDKRFLSQFKAGDLRAKFKPYSKYPPCFKDVSFWQPKADAEGEAAAASSSEVSENDLCEQVRGVAGDLVESVSLLDAFTHPKTGRSSACYRIAYRSMERSLSDEEVNAMQERVRELLATELGVELR